MSTSFGALFSRAWGLEGAGTALDEALRGAYEHAVRAFPAVRCAPERFVAHLARHLAEDTGRDLAAVPQALAGLRTDELYLAVAAAAGDHAAVAELERAYFAPTAAAVERLRVDTIATDDVLQELRTAMLVETSAREPELLRYSGRGNLAGWLRVVATRAALRSKRSRHARPVEPDASVLDEVVRQGDDPELAPIRERYGRELEEALAWSFGQLAADQRVLLRMYVVDGLTLAELGAVHGVDASTVSRWLQSIRSALGENAKSRLIERLALRPSECESLVGILRGNLHLSVARLLRNEPQHDD